MDKLKWIAQHVLLPIAVIVIALLIFERISAACECKKQTAADGPEATLNDDGTVTAKPAASNSSK
jgi:hypothetical protein